jgi:hypothetical protein
MSQGAVNHRRGKHHTHQSPPTGEKKAEVKKPLADNYLRKLQPSQREKKIT